MRAIPTIGYREALDIQDYLLKVAAEDQLAPVAICIVDATGTLLAAVTMDGTKMPSIKTAHDKAVTAVHFQRDTMEFRYVRDGGAWRRAHTSAGDGWDVHDILAATKINSTFTHWGGGVLIRSITGSIVGAIGVSNRTEEEDHNLASKWTDIWHS